MRGARRSRPSNSFLCVIADQCLDDAHCDKSFPTIEKHNEHLKRCHSSDFWCLKCLHKFNCSLPAGPLRLAKKEHDKTQCPGEPSQENQQLWNSTWIMTPEQYGRFKDRGWKKTHVSNEVLLGLEKDSVPQKSWRRIRETIFPGSDDTAIRRRISELAASRHTEDILSILAQVENRQSTVMPQLLFDTPVPGADAMQLARSDTVLQSLYTEESQMSTIFSEETHLETHPSSRVWSHSGGDEQHHLYRAELERPSTVDPVFLQMPEERDGHQTSEPVASAEYAMDPIPPEVLWHFSLSQQQEGTRK